MHFSEKFLFSFFQVTKHLREQESQRSTDVNKSHSPSPASSTWTLHLCETHLSYNSWTSYRNTVWKLD